MLLRRSPLLPAVFGVLVSATILVHVEPSYADGPTVSRADREKAASLKKEADAAMDTLRNDDALRLYSESFALYPDPAILYNRGRVYGARGEYQLAVADLERFEREAPPETRAKVPNLAALIAEMRSHIATVTVKANEEGARVLIRDRVVGTTPLDKPVQVVAGTVPIEVTKDGFRSYKEMKELVGGKETVLTVELTPLDTKGVLVIRAAKGAPTVFVDGKAAGSAPLELTVEAGQHKVIARANGYEETTTAAVVAAGERKTIDLELQPTPSIVTRWWFWTAAGAVVAAGGVALYAAFKERPPSNGDNFTPSKLPGPLKIAW